MKATKFFWAFGDHELTPDPAMTRARLAAMLNSFRNRRTVERLGAHHYRVTHNDARATIRIY